MSVAPPGTQSALVRLSARAGFAGGLAAVGAAVAEVGVATVVGSAAVGAGALAAVGAGALAAVGSLYAQLRDLGAV